MPEWLSVAIPVGIMLAGFASGFIAVRLEARRHVDPPPTPPAFLAALEYHHHCEICDQSAKGRASYPTWPGPNPAPCDECGHPIWPGDSFTANALNEAVHPFACCPTWEQPPTGRTATPGKDMR